jgi:hypothetical protein
MVFVDGLLSLKDRTGPSFDDPPTPLTLGPSSALEWPGLRSVEVSEEWMVSLEIINSFGVL